MQKLVLGFGKCKELIAAVSALAVNQSKGQRQTWNISAKANELGAKHSDKHASLTSRLALASMKLGFQFTRWAAVSCACWSD